MPASAAPPWSKANTMIASQRTQSARLNAAKASSMRASDRLPSTAVASETEPILSLLKNYGLGRGTGGRQVSGAVGAIATSVLAAARYACSLAWRNW